MSITAFKITIFHELKANGTSSLTVDSSDFFSGGTITVDGIPMIIPKNSYVTLPSISVMWSELFVDGVPQLPQFRAPGVSWEATVFGNRVGDSYIVGLVYITQSSVRIIQYVKLYSCFLKLLLESRTNMCIEASSTLLI
jgi:hypothetical protein